MLQTLAKYRTLIAGAFLLAVAVAIVTPILSYRVFWRAEDHEPLPSESFSLILFAGEDSEIGRAVWATLDEYESDSINVLMANGTDARFPRSAFTTIPPAVGADRLVALMNEVLSTESETRRVDFQHTNGKLGSAEVTVTVVGPRGRHTLSCYSVNKEGVVRPLYMSALP